jgi:shikimate dehydrogenase
VTGGSTRVFAVIGDPVAHSISPAMHGAAFRALGVNAVYVALRASGNDVAPLLRALCRSGGGASITAPNKQTVARLLAAPTDLVREVGGCNAVWGVAGPDGMEPALAGDNTDVAGIIASMGELGVDGGDWLVAGTGGGARAAVMAARALGAGVAVRSRDADRRHRFESWMTTVGVPVREPQCCTVLVNATPLGRRSDDPLPLDAQLAPAAAAALDLVYAPRETGWVRAMRARGLRALDGRTMLVAQGAAAFARWFPGLEPPVEVMRAAVADALR